MPLKASDLTYDQKQRLLSQIRDQTGKIEYDRLVDALGEDGLIDLVLKEMTEAQQPTSKSRPMGTTPKVSRIVGLIAGLILGTIIGGFFFGASWLLNIWLEIPQWYSLAAWFYVSLIAPFASLFLCHAKKLDFRKALLFYTLATLVGGLLGAGRWLFHIEWSFVAFVKLLGASNECLGILVVIGIIISVVMWLVTLGKSDVPWDIGPFLFLILLLVACPVAMLADAPLYELPGVELLITQNTLLVPALTAGVGGLLGLLCPPN